VQRKDIECDKELIVDKKKVFELQVFDRTE